MIECILLGYVAHACAKEGAVEAAFHLSRLQSKCGRTKFITVPGLFNWVLTTKTDKLIRSGGEIDDSFTHTAFALATLDIFVSQKKSCHDFMMEIVFFSPSFVVWFLPWKTLVGWNVVLHSGGISSLPKCSRELRVVFAIDGRSNAQVIGWTRCQGGRGSWKFAGHQKRDSGTHTATWVVVEVDGEMVGIFVKVWVEFGGS